MEIFDHIKLKYEIPELAERRIHKGYTGEVIGIDKDTYKVVFYSPRIYGDFAIAAVKADTAEFLFRPDERLNKGSKEFLKTLDESKHTCLLDDDVHEYDEIEMIVEKEKYANRGIHKGMIGTVMDEEAYYNEWYVIFSDPNGSGVDIADMRVHRDDFKIIYKSPVHREKKSNSTM